MPTGDQKARPSEFASVKDVAVALKLAPSTIYDAVRSGVIPHVRIGRSIRIPMGWLVESNRGPGEVQ